VITHCGVRLLARGCTMGSTLSWYHVEKVRHLMRLGAASCTEENIFIFARICRLFDKTKALGLWRVTTLRIRESGKGKLPWKHKGSRGIGLLMFNLSATCAKMFNPTPRPPFPRWRTPVPILQEAVWAPGPVLTGVEKREVLAVTWFRTPNLPACSESL
jgi:hypothetical protein